MEKLETRIKEFLSTTSGDGSGLGSGCGFFDSSGCGYGDSSGYVSFYGSGDGSGLGDGKGYIRGDGDGSGNGKGFGSDDGCGYGSGNGFESRRGVKELNGENVHLVDGIQAIIKSVHGNIAQGFILNSDLTLHPCYIVKEQNKFAHGDTLHDAFTSLQEKLERIYDESTEEERIEAFVKKFPNYDTPYSNRDLFDYHHVLTGSCRMGRESF